MEKELSPQESLSIIQGMIDKTKHTLSDSSHYFLLWGYAVFLGCAIQYALIQAEYSRHYQAWWIILVAIILHIFLGFRDNKKQRASTYIGEANGFLWMGIGFSFMSLSFILMNVGWQNCFPFYILFYGLGTFVSGNLLKFKPLIIGGAASFALAAVAGFLAYQEQVLLTALSILTSYIIPGHLLRTRYHKQKQSL